MGDQKNKDSALLVILSNEGNVVLVKKINHPRPMLRVPGGEIEEGETPLVAAKREFAEETGMEVSGSIEVRFLFSDWNTRHEHWYHVFGCIVPEFSGLHAHAVPDGPDMLATEVCDLTEAFADGAMVPQHLSMLRKAVEKIAVFA